MYQLKMIRINYPTYLRENNHIFVNMSCAAITVAILRAMQISSRTSSVAAIPYGIVAIRNFAHIRSDILWKLCNETWSKWQRRLTAEKPH